MMTSQLKGMMIYIDGLPQVSIAASICCTVPVVSVQERYNQMKAAIETDGNPSMYIIIPLG